MKQLLTLSIALAFITCSINQASAQVTIQFKLNVQGGDVFLYWEASNQSDITYYVIDRLKKGLGTYQPVASVAGNGEPTFNYSFYDKNLEEGSYTYRISVRYKNGTEEAIAYADAEIGPQDRVPSTPLPIPSNFGTAF